MSSALPKEKQSAYQRWEMASFDEAPPLVSISPPHDEFKEQIAAEREEAKLAGYEEGLVKGMEEGLGKGFEEGHAKGLEEGRAQALQEKLRLQEIAETFSTEISKANETISESLLDLTLDLAKAMLKTTLAVKPEHVIPIVAEAIHYLPSLQQPALLFLHPEDAVLVKDLMGEELAAGGWRIVEEQMDRGGCRIETASNQIDAGTATRWQRLMAAFGKNSDWLVS